jgi:TorA maturation chaperone TorD
MKTMPRTPQLDIPACLRQLCRLFWGPEIEQCREMKKGLFFSPFETPCLLEIPGTAKALERISTYVTSIPDERMLYEAFESAYIQLFISSKGGIVAPLYQSCYAFDGAPLMGPPATRMQGRLEAVGLSLSGIRSNEPPDHLAVVLEYLYYVLEQGASDSFSEIRSEAVSFVRTEMIPWINAFTERLSLASDSGLYLPAAFLTGVILSRII